MEKHMNKPGVMAAAISICAAVAIPILVLGQSLPAPNRPSFVAEEAWVPLAPELGFVLTQEAEPAGARVNPMNPRPATGYFAVKVGGTWRRVDIEQLARRMPAH
jgi:hypothetical protein